jgi:uroporphyrinogen decarboxylase
MNSRERFSLAMHHVAPDRPPIDIGGTSLTSMSRRCQSTLRDHLGLNGDPAPTNSGVDERILRWAGTDFRSVGAIVDLPSALTSRISETAHVNCWGIRHDVFGQYSEITGHPLKGASVEDLRTFAWPDARIDEELLERWEREAEMLRTEGEFVIVGEHPVFGILELGCWMCGYDEFLMKLAGDKDFVRVFFDRVYDIQMAVIEQYYSALGPYIDLTTSGDDFGMQMGPLLSPRSFEELIAPYFAGRIRRTKELAGCYYWHHTCGSVARLLDQIIDCGVDIINPIQTSAAGMEPGALKSRFGDRIVFWGAVDVQQFLPSATPDEVRATTHELVTILGKGGGYVMAPAHNMQSTCLLRTSSRGWRPCTGRTRPEAEDCLWFHHASVCSMHSTTLSRIVFRSCITAPRPVSMCMGRSCLSCSRPTLLTTQSLLTRSRARHPAPSTLAAATMNSAQTIGVQPGSGAFLDYTDTPKGIRSPTSAMRRTTSSLPYLRQSPPRTRPKEQELRRSGGSSSLFGG